MYIIRVPFLLGSKSLVFESIRKKTIIRYSKRFFLYNCFSLNASIAHMSDNAQTKINLSQKQEDSFIRCRLIKQLV